MYTGKAKPWFPLLRGLTDLPGLLWGTLLESMGSMRDDEYLHIRSLTVGFEQDPSSSAHSPDLNGYLPAEPHSEKWEIWNFLRSQLLQAFDVPLYGDNVSKTLRLDVPSPAPGMHAVT